MCNLNIAYKSLEPFDDNFNVDNGEELVVVIVVVVDAFATEYNLVALTQLMGLIVFDTDLNIISWKNINGTSYTNN